MAGSQFRRVARLVAVLALLVSFLAPDNHSEIVEAIDTDGERNTTDVSGQAVQPKSWILVDTKVTTFCSTGGSVEKFMGASTSFSEQRTCGNEITQTGNFQTLQISGAVPARFSAAEPLTIETTSSIQVNWNQTAAALDVDQVSAFVNAIASTPTCQAEEPKSGTGTGTPGEFQSRPRRRCAATRRPQMTRRF